MRDFKESRVYLRRGIFRFVTQGENLAHLLSPIVGVLGFIIVMYQMLNVIITSVIVKLLFC